MPKKKRAIFVVSIAIWFTCGQADLFHSLHVEEMESCVQDDVPLGRLASWPGGECGTGLVDMVVDMVVAMIVVYEKGIFLGVFGKVELTTTIRSEGCTIQGG